MSARPTVEDFEAAQELMLQAADVIRNDGLAFQALDRDATLTAAIAMLLYAKEDGHPDPALYTDPMVFGRVAAIKALMLVATEVPS